MFLPNSHATADIVGYHISGEIAAIRRDGRIEFVDSEYTYKIIGIHEVNEIAASDLLAGEVVVCAARNRNFWNAYWRFGTRLVSCGSSEIGDVGATLLREGFAQADCSARWVLYEPCHE